MPARLMLIALALTLAACAGTPDPCGPQAAAPTWELYYDATSGSLAPGDVLSGSLSGASAVVVADRLGTMHPSVNRVATVADWNGVEWQIDEPFAGPNGSGLVVAFVAAP